MNIIQDLINQARAYQWPYPKLFEELRKQNVTSYSVHFTGGKGYEALYVTPTETIKEETPQGYEEIDASELFDESKIKEAIIDNAHKKITYVQFLSRIAQAGVTHYTVNMPERLVTYYNKDESQFYEQKVPFFSEANPVSENQSA